MFGKSKKPETGNAADSKKAASSGASADQGELILEQLFMDEQPPTKTSRFAALAEEAEVVEAAQVSSAPKSRQDPATPKQFSGKTNSGLLSGVFSRKPKARAPGPQREAPDVAPVESLGIATVATGTPSADSSPEVHAAEHDGPPVTSTMSEVSVTVSKPAKARAPKAFKKSTSRRNSRDIYLSAQIAGDRSIFWKLTAQGIEPVEALPAGSHALSFSKDDLRFEVETRVSYSAAQSLALQEVGDAVYLLNRSKDLRAVYATLRSRIEGLHYRLGPGQLLLDRLIQERASEAEALIVAVELKDLSGRDALLILYYLSATGRSSEPQISVYPDNREFLLSQFAAVHQASRENAQVLLVDHTALFEASTHAAFYPNEPQLGGIPLRKVWSQSAMAGVLVAIAALGWAYQGFTQNDQIRRSTTRVQSSIDFAQKTASGLLSSSPRALARALTLDVEQILARSQRLWVPGSRIQLTADGGGAEYRITLSLPHVRTSAVTANGTEGNTDALSTLLHLKAPEGCQRENLNFSGTLNEAQLNVRCEAAPHPLDHYRSG